MLLDGGGFLNDKRDALDLFLIVKCQAADVSIWVCFFALTDFIQDLSGVIAPEHWQFPECPISPIIIPWHSAVFPAHTSHLTIKASKAKKKSKKERKEEINQFPFCSISLRA